MKKKTFRERYGKPNAISEVYKEIKELIEDNSKKKKTTKKKVK